MPISEDRQFDAPYAAAFQGAHGALSEDAARDLLGDADEPLLSCPRLEEVFDAVRGGRARFGVVPIENQLAGSVHVCYDLLLERELAIVGERSRTFSLALVVKPGTPFERVRLALSHPVLLALCAGFFRANPFVEPRPAFDSALAVERVVGSERDDLAAIATPRAALVHGGEVLDGALEGDPGGTARFLQIARPSEARLAFDGPFDAYKTSVAFAAENEPGALCACLGGFAERGISLAKIESRPLGGADGGFHFYLDVLGRVDDERMAAALDELEAHASKVRVLGCYRRHEPPFGGLRNRRVPISS